MEKKELIQVLFRVSRAAVKRFDGILKDNDLTRQAVLADFLEGYSEMAATHFLVSQDKLGELRDELRSCEFQAEQIKEQIALFQERAAKLQESAKPKASAEGLKKPKAEAGQKGKKG